MSELNEAQGYAASLRQQATWIDETVNATVPVHSRIDLGDVDTDELRAAAAFIDRSELIWQPIETAPRDGAGVNIYVPANRPERRILSAYLADNGEWWVMSGSLVVGKPTLWCHLPPAPEAQPAYPSPLEAMEALVEQHPEFSSILAAVKRAQS